MPPRAGGSNRLHLDPQFVNPALGDYHLSAGSPPIDEGNPAEAPTTPYELDLAPRTIDGTSSGVATVDMGYDEWNSAHNSASGTVSL
ncbi:MAG: serine protease [Bacteroidia bacterium]